MEFVGGLIAFVLIPALAFIGFIQAPLWVPLLAAIPGVILYFMIRPGAVILIHRAGFSYLLMIYLAQLFTCGLIFFIGYGIGALVR